MSLATFKKKTQSQYKNNSVGQKNFSINGTTRLQGYVGQDSRSRSLIKTPMVGNVYKGYGGHLGTYKQSVVYPSGIQYQENETDIVKPSVLSNSGSIATHYRWIRRPAPFATVKPDNPLNQSQGAYVANLSRAVVNSIVESPLKTTGGSLSANTPYIYKYTNYNKKALCTELTTKTLGPLCQSDYTFRLSDACTGTTLPRITYNVQREPFAGF
jgi:hypothetical protein